MVVGNVTEYLKVLQKKESTKDFVVDVLVKAIHETNRLADDMTWILMQTDAVS